MKKLSLILIIMAMTGLNACGQSNPNLYSTQVGDIKITLLSEGQGNGDTRILINASEDILQQYAPEGTFSIATNAFLLQDEKEGGYVLFDAGYGRELGKNMEALNVKPEDINVICLTHMHGDHIGGLIKDDQAVFPNAKLLVAQKEYDYWNSSENAGAKKVLEVYKDQLEIFEPIDLENIKIGSAPILPIEAYGHTPGHTAFLIHSNGKNLMIWGDLAHAMAVQMPRPEIAVTYDVNPEEAIKSRMEILEFVTKNSISIAGMHIPYPGIGNVEKDGKGYKFRFQ